MGENAIHLRDQAKRCRRLARGIIDEATVQKLNQAADEFERAAEACEAAERGAQESGDSPER